MKATFKALGITWAEFTALLPEDRVLSNTRVYRVIRWLPGIGKQRAEQMLSELGISGRRRVGNLPEAMAVRLSKHRFVKSYSKRVRRLRRRLAGQS